MTSLFLFPIVSLSNIRYLGLVALVVFTVLFFQVYIEGRHEYQENGVGSVVTKFSGKAFARGNDGSYIAYDAADLLYPEVDTSGTFITTREVSMVGQKLGICDDADQPCSSSNFCAGGTF